MNFYSYYFLVYWFSICYLLLHFLSMIEVPLYPNGYPCKCSVNCNYSKAYEDAGKPKYIDYETYIKNFTPVKTRGTHS